MVTVTEALAENEQLKAENDQLKRQLRDIKAPEVMQAKIDLKTAEIQAAVDLKAGVHTKPITETEKAELAAMHQRNIEALQAEKAELEQEQAALEALVVPV